MILISIRTDGQIRSRIETGRSFAASVLAEEHADLSALFARRDRPRGLAACRWLGAAGVTGNALVADAVAVIECRLYEQYPCGDHILFVGEVVAASQYPGLRRPLVFHRSSYAVLR